MSDTTPQRNLILILARNFATRLATAVFLVDADGRVIFFNEAAEPTLGVRADDVDQMPYETWTTSFAPRDLEGNAIAGDDLPSVKALREQKPQHDSLQITGADGVARQIVITAFPLTGGHGDVMGSVTMFWESDER